MTTPATVDRPMTVSLQTLRYLGLDPNDVHTHALVAVAQRYRLDPLLGQVELIETGGAAKVYITAAGMLAFAHRSGQLDGIRVVEERRSSEDDGWTCYVEVKRKDMSGTFTRGAQCKDTERQAKNGHGPVTAETRALRRTLCWAFDLPDVDIDPDEDEAYGWEGDADAEPVIAGPAHALAVPAPATLPPDWPIEGPTSFDNSNVGRSLAEVVTPVTARAPKSSQAAAHKAVGALTADAQREFLDRHGIDDYGTVWPADAVDEALELPL